MARGSESSNGGYVALENGEYTDSYGGMFDQPLLCFGCGIGWFLFLLGIIFPVAWFLGTFLYLTNYYKSDPRERAGLGACAAAALICTVILFIILLVVLLKHWRHTLEVFTIDNSKLMCMKTLLWCEGCTPEFHHSTENDHNVLARSIDGEKLLMSKGGICSMRWININLYKFATCIESKLCWNCRSK